MPRVSNVGPSVDAWSRRTHEGSSVYDLCDDCAGTILMHPHAFDRKLQPYGQGEPQGERGWEPGVAHPPYGPVSPVDLAYWQQGAPHPRHDSEVYHCRACGKPLSEEHDG